MQKQHIASHQITSHDTRTDCIVLQDSIYRTSHYTIDIAVQYRTFLCVALRLLSLHLVASHYVTVHSVKSLHYDAHCIRRLTACNPKNVPINCWDFTTMLGSTVQRPSCSAKCRGSLQTFPRSISGNGYSFGDFLGI